MSTIELKNKIVDKLNFIQDSSILNTVLTYLESNDDSTNLEEIVAYTIKGNPISRKEYLKRNNQAMESFKKGNFKTQKQILEKYNKASN